MDAFSAGVGSFPLVLAAEGERVRVVALASRQGMDGKLADLGLCPGTEVTIVNREQGGRMLIARDDMRLALGPGVAHRVLVARIEDAP
jgi:ferrous iron transport protein A